MGLRKDVEKEGIIFLGVKFSENHVAMVLAICCEICTLEESSGVSDIYKRHHSPTQNMDWSTDPLCHVK